MLNQSVYEDVFMDAFMWNDHAQMREVKEGKYEDIKDASKGTEWERAKNNWNCIEEINKKVGREGGVGSTYLGIHPSSFVRMESW